MPEYTCVSCGNHGPFKTVKHGSPVDPVDYDIECLECGSLDVRETQEAIDEMVEQRDKLEAKLQTEKDAKYIRMDNPFQFVRKWLEAYDAAQDTKVCEDVMSWINVQPMSQG